MSIVSDVAPDLQQQLQLREAQCTDNQLQLRGYKPQHSSPPWEPSVLLDSKHNDGLKQESVTTLNGFTWI